ncbi:FAD/NAD(P)-binding domain-containing protein [Auricularia subglabra TFB-10046 SS5]|nr:FAD/NAD(P)-binding domain-containing protein [Auricularia subglabra TFB-10046 SS5]
MPSVAVIGAGLAGLITAKTLLDDEFDVHVFTRDETVGGVWCRKRAYPGLYLNNVHGEYHFSSLPMPPPKGSCKTGGRLRGEDVTAYLEKFAETFLTGKITVCVEILDAAPSGGRWDITLQHVDRSDAVQERLHFDKLVVCNGGASNPSVPTGLSETMGRFSGPVFHSQELRQNMERIAAIARASEHPICVIGGGRSAQDTAAYFANNNAEVCMIFDTADAFIAAPIPLPAFIRKSRLLAILAGSIDLNTRLERFLHATRLGAWIVSSFWGLLQRTSLWTFGVPATSPIARAHSAFWSIRVNDEGVGAQDNFYSNLKRGKIQLIAPAHARCFGADGKSVVLEDGRSVQACAVVLATGYKSSWAPIFRDETRREIGLNRHPVAATTNYSWSHLSIQSPPSSAPEWARISSLYRGLVPVGSLDRRNFAVNGAVFSTNPSHCCEVSAHWISSYFLDDQVLKLPPSIDDANAETERQADFMRKRHPTVLAWVNESYSSGIAFWTWPQYIDQLLADMGLRTGRSGGNWLTWPFRVVSNAEITTLSHERRMKRESYCDLPS